MHAEEPSPEHAASQEPLEKDDGDLSELLEERRVLLPGAQTLTAFLIILPFNGGFAQSATRSRSSTSSPSSARC